LQDLIAGLERRGSFDEVIHAFFQVLDLDLKIVDVFLDALEDLGRGAGNVAEWRWFFSMASMRTSWPRRS
jgi:hypothetical protein